ncbi:hypothetical protein J9253_06045 [Thiothrix litoralis]|uniref:Uncharacterized protein n=1 Tax=Thiothrix litoralis TaxID=2891210 RepID=A0ABX7WUV7_9GAMM|nr:hypothetical protein [Thiothrix litoralis]QTR47494.1 hypothetical protein J9253_06045 [Thiothrix litoralis]
MNRSVEAILKQIHGESIILEIFTDAAAADRHDECSKHKMLDAAVLVLESLQALHTDLKQAMEVQP